jgi:pyridoxamine 5'-phosphate oxidase
MSDLPNEHPDFLIDFNFDLKENPLELFQSLYQDAIIKNCAAPNAMVISTVDQENQPSSRVVFLREIFTEGITFYTNYLSEKGKNLKQNPKCSALFFWQELEIQVRIKGSASPLPTEISDIYFQSRPRLNQLSAWASEQSKTIENKAILTERIDFYDKKFPNDVPRPDYWGGFVIKPNYYEFWKGRLGRLHDRMVYTQSENDKWNIHRLAP